ncbi:MAG TPA: redoxin domain-containing protein [Solirubrobacteraceae bacterium]
MNRGRRYGWFLALVAVALIAYISLNTLRSEHVGSTGLKVGSKLPPFAAPLALGPVNGDVNVARKAGQGSAGAKPACSVRGPGILNSCQLAERGPFVIAFMATRGAQCTRQLDALQRLVPRHPDLQVAAVSIRGNRDDLRALVRRHGWRFPVAYDHDGILANLFGVAVCPQLTYALPGGAVQATSVGEVDVRDLDARLTSLERAARAKGWRP